MASACRQDTGELVGYLTEPEGPFPGGITYWPFKAWLHSDGKLRSDPEPGTDETTPDVTVDIPARNNDSANVHLIVSPDLVDFIVTHKAFRREQRRYLDMSEPGTQPEFLFEDRQTPGDWHVQWTDENGGFEMAIFSGPRAHERAIMFAERCYGGYEKVRSNQG